MPYNPEAHYSRRWRYQQTRTKGLPPMRLETELVEEFGLANGGALGHLLAADPRAPAPMSVLMNPYRRWYNPEQVRAWWELTRQEQASLRAALLADHYLVVSEVVRATGLSRQTVDTFLKDATHTLRHDLFLKLKEYVK